VQERLFQVPISRLHLRRIVSTARFRIEVIKVPVAAPQDARIISTPRLFADSTGNIASLWKGGSRGQGTQSSAGTARTCAKMLWCEITGLPWRG
jgi:hypothetical protein